MKKLVLFLILACAFAFCTSCEKSQSNKNNAVNMNNNEVTVENEAPSVFEDEIFEVLPDEAIDSFNFVTDNAKNLFPDAQGKWMYGYKGIVKIENAQCYEFALYTYKDKVHTKIGTVATTMNSDTLYILDEFTGEYSQADLAKDETGNTTWAETTTLAFAKVG